MYEADRSSKTARGGGPFASFSPGLTWPRLASPGFTGPHRASLGLAGSHRACTALAPCSTASLPNAEHYGVEYLFNAPNPTAFSLSARMDCECHLPQWRIRLICAGCENSTAVTNSSSNIHEKCGLPNLSVCADRRSVSFVSCILTCLREQW